jgi:hypothetical protein
MQHHIGGFLDAVIRVCDDPPSKFAGQDSAPTFTCLRLPVDVRPVLARVDEVIEQSAICCSAYVGLWHKADISRYLLFVRSWG